MWHRKAAACKMCNVYRQMCLLFMLLGAALGATPFAKEYRSAGLFKGNTLMDMELDAATTLDIAVDKLTDSSSSNNGGAMISNSEDLLAFKAESSVVVPGVQQNAGEFNRRDSFMTFFQFVVFPLTLLVIIVSSSFWVIFFETCRKQ